MNTLVIAAQNKIIEAISLTPNQSLPGLSFFTKMAGGIMTAVEYGLILAMVLCAGMWGISSHLSNTGLSIKFRNGLFIALVAGIIVGIANPLMNWAFNTNIGIV
jgi:Family of unknown function (DUF6112)